MNEKLTKPYDPKETEGRIYKMWEKSGFFNPDNLPERHQLGKPFVIVMPPPNANGDLHAGHSLFITLEDIFTRYYRMKGYRALWIPGADHAGFETQVVYEKQLEKEGRSRFNMEPEDLYREILDFTLANKSNMERQVREMGASCDWSREKFTLDADVVAEVQRTFKKMYDDGLIYRGLRIINWCPKHQTSLSDVETVSEEQRTPFYYFKYGPFEIGTTRPETKFGDKYVTMHPDDVRYKDYQHGQKILLEWINGPVEATVIKDEANDMEMGTGVMTITPYHSQVDFEIAERHNLDGEQIIDWRGRLLPIAGELAGMKIGDAREKIVDKLRSKALVTRVDENYTNVVKKCYKCNTVIEPQVKEQWFVKMKPLAELAIAALDKKELTFIPDHQEKVFRYWMENSIDWNISRQIVWGIPIPAWLCDDCGTSHVELDIAATPKCSKCDKAMRRDADTFDTWFSSGQWPLLVTNYPDGQDFGTYYPTDIMETGHDLVFKWVPRMVIFGLYLSKRVPFHTVYMHGLVNDAQGRKMSKSKGNVISPSQLTDKFGTDALRMALVIGNTPGTDLALSEDKVKGQKHFANKLWNIARFVLDNSAEETAKPRSITPGDEAILKNLRAAVESITAHMDNNRFYLAAEEIYHYIWHEFADKIIEEMKPRLREGDSASPGGSAEDRVDNRQSAQYTLRVILETSVKLLHPFMPFVTEEIWQILREGKSLLMVEPWPQS
ncbi:MAG: valine--tRNA ligase [Candidatus Vogelbacteria bacterium CG10_big_fil_rev_8_21_14_0_10_51_16]|uniref:Valine--tRNA ligase n=1 Tax=Candidatus Vogelbacteria bacterium CG10_big_fil_rev_8_21_14_0_10_51_16 TaxID=1975045 RepID=A0A2H0RES7_9BACT|nr:MAG: valine--tRNA ligase [Candidatus Vogelbacteria bacterium CG10_big_fil_rev_8_21_14_0_10_51_16]